MLRFQESHKNLTHLSLNADVLLIGIVLALDVIFGGQ